MDESENPLQALFAEALEITDAAERAAFLNRTCGPDANLRREVEELLQAEADAGKFLPDQPAATASRSPLLELAETAGPFDAFPSAALTEEPGDRIGRYELVEKIGEGGCGVVYLARQETPVRRQVALKVIKLGMDTRQVIARFEAERQALAMMDHANIAKVFDAGATDSQHSTFNSQLPSGRPYFVMELVRGSRITDYCNQHQLSTRARLELFIQVCQAVQHAHQKGIIHRDLKPSNVLVTESDGEPVPKVIDFGIAKATEGKLTDQTLFTAFEQFLGTPAYMSPEQAALTSVDIDTRSDIYSLGVLLYELLTGTTPFDTRSLLAVGVDELRRTIREKEPPTPSTRLKQELLAHQAPETGKSTFVNRKSQIPNDLDWIVMKCLEKDRARRYETANGLAADLRRHLNNEPVIARPPSRLYEFQKTVRRHKLGFAATAAVITALLVGLAFAVAGFLQARHQRDLANLRAYTSDMNLVQQAWNEGNLRRAQTILKKYAPKPGALDLRGFEWRYLWRLCQDESRLSFTNFPAEVRMALSPDGSFLAAGSRRIVRLLDHANLRELGTLQLPEGTPAITTVAFLPPDTNVLATASETTLHFWNLAERRITRTVTLSRRSVALAFSRDGRFLASAGGSGATVELRLVEDGSLVWIRQTPAYVQALAFAPDGKSLISGGGESDNTLVWDLAVGASSPFPGEHSGWINAIVFSPNGEIMATTSNDSTVILWDFAARKLLTRLIPRDGGATMAAAFSRDGRWLVTGHSDSRVRLWDIISGREKAIYRGHKNGVTSVALSPDGRSILSSSWDKTVKIWDQEPRAHEAILTPYRSWASYAKFSPDGKRLVASAVTQGGLTVWDVAARHRISQLTQPSTNTEPSAVFSPNGEILAQIWADRIKLWNARTLTCRGELTNGFDAISLSISPDNRTLAAAGLALFDLHGITNRLVFWDLATQRKFNKLQAAAPFAIIVGFSHDGQKVAIGYLNGEVRVWDYETERLLADFTDQHQRIWSVAFSPDDAWLVAGGEDGTVVFHDLHTRRTFRPIQTSSWILGLSFTPDGKTLASAEGDGTIKLWNTATREVALALRGHLGAASNVSFSPDGNILASCGGDGTVRLWAAAAFGEIAERRKAQ